MIQNMKTLFLLLFTITLSTVSCQSNDANADFNMTASELKQVMSTDTTLVILDVRTPPELTGQHGQIDGVINIPVQVLSKRVNELEEYKGKNIAVICRSGNRSVMATKIMQANGHKARNVLGGMKAYNKQ